MKKEIAMDDIAFFQKRYNEEEINEEIERKIKEFGIMKASIDDSKMNNLKFEFNIEVPDNKIYNQLDSHQCNIYAFLKVVKDIMRKNTDLDVDNLDLSSNYVAFYDKFEKANTLYNNLINDNNLSLEKINSQVSRYIGSFGTFHFCRDIVNKYGLVPAEYMPEVNNKYNDYLTIELLKHKIKCDAIDLINKSKEEKIRSKKKLMYEVYEFLSKVYGNPPMSFEYQGECLTPIKFKNLYLKNELDNYVTVTSFDKEILFQSYAFIPNIYLNDDEKIMRLPVEKIKKSVVKQLNDGISVWFSAEESTTLDYDINILDDELYNFNDLLNIKNVSKSKKMSLDIINYDHAMCITGVLVEENQIKQFKVLNSFGKHGKYNGQLIMTNSFFENCIITLLINKKYLSND